MIRINLLPPEIIEKRRWERRWVWVIFGGVALFALLVVFFGVMYLQVITKRSDVAVKQQEALSLQAAANSFKVFEDRQTDLQSREGVVKSALGGRVDWTRLFNELSLVLPADVWLSTLAGDEKQVQFSGYAVDSQVADREFGHKAVARLLVRLADVEQLQNVWLTSSAKQLFVEKPTLQFAVQSQMTSNTAVSVPAPPSSP